MRTVFREVAQSLRRNVSMVISVVLVTFISLTFVGAAALLQLQIAQMKTFWYDRAQVAVYMCTDISPAAICPGGEASADQLAAVKAKLESPTLTGFVKTFYFEDHEQAYAKFQEQFKGNTVAEYVKAEQLNQTYWVNMVDPNQSAILSEALAGQSGVEEVRDQRSYLDQIFAILNGASLGAISVAGLMLFSAGLLISTTIRLSAFSRRRELGIMRLVGASNFYIRLPFVLEGVVAALIGSLLAGGAIVGLVEFVVQGVLKEEMPMTNLVTLTDAWLVVPLLIGAGTLVAALASGAAIRRYLRV